MEQEFDMEDAFEFNFDVPEVKEEEKPSGATATENNEVDNTEQEQEDGFFDFSNDKEVSEDKPDKKSKSVETAGKSGEKTEDSSLTDGYFDFLKTSGVFNIPDDFVFDGSEESLEKAHQITIDSYKTAALDLLLERFPPHLQDMAIYALKGGTEFDKFQAQQGDDLDTLEGQTKTLTKYYQTNTKWSKEKIDKYISTLSEDEVEKEARDAEAEMKEQNEAQRKALIKAEEDRQKAHDENVKKYNDSLAANLQKANYIAADRKTKLKNFIFNVSRKEDGMMSEMIRTFNSIQSNPEHFIQLADLFLDYDKEKGIAYSRFEKNGQTTLNKNLKKALEESVNKKISAFANNPKTGTVKEIDWSQFQI